MGQVGRRARDLQICRNVIFWVFQHVCDLGVKDVVNWEPVSVQPAMRHPQLAHGGIGVHQLVFPSRRTPSAWIDRLGPLRRQRRNGCIPVIGSVVRGYRRDGKFQSDGDVDAADEAHHATVVFNPFIGRDLPNGETGIEWRDDV